MKANATKRYPLGCVVATPGALAALEESGTSAIVYLQRHAAGDWGEVCQEDKKANEFALKEGLRILSAYKLPVTSEKLWVITEADRSATTLLLPDEY